MKNNLQDILLAKSGKAIISIARDFFDIPLDGRIPTVTELENKYDFSRGTIQNAIKVLKDLNIINTLSRGYQGTYLIGKDINMLLQIMGVSSVVGCMPLPYSKRYEGLATGLIASIENQYDVNSNLVFVRGAKNRIAMLLSDRYDYAIISKLAAKKLIEDGNDIMIIKEFGPYSYVSDHVIVFNDSKVKKINKGMKIGVDNSSIDHKLLTDVACKGKDVKRVNISYSNILKKVMSGEIDCTIWNKDEIFDKFMGINYVKIDKSKDDTIATVVVRKDRKEIESFLKKAIDEDIVIENQKMVINGMIIPSY